MQSDLAHLSIQLCFTQDKMPALFAHDPTPSFCLFKDIAWRFSPTSNFPSLLDLYLLFTYMVLLCLFFLKKVLTPFLFPVTTLLSLISFKQKLNSCACSLSPTPILPVKPIHTSTCFSHSTKNCQEENQ